jgi:hypothetical protein
MKHKYKKNASKNRPPFIFSIIVSIVLVTITSCKKFVEIDPPKTATVSEVVFSNDGSAISAIRGIYSEMSFGGIASGSFFSVTLTGGLLSDEFIGYQTGLNDFYTNSLTANNVGVTSDAWNQTYKFIYYSNSMIEGLANSSGVTAAVKKQLEGEAKFLRAFCHFYLVNLFGDIPLITTTDYRINSIASRTPKDLVYQQIISDLIDAQNMLASDYSWSNNERVRVNKWAATALLARAYLYTGEWMKAETQASAVINNSGLYSLPSDLNTVFLKNSNETIWQLMQVNPGYNTNEAGYFIPASAMSPPEFVSLTSQLFNDFEAGDQRKAKWVGSITVGLNIYYFPYKYKIRDFGQPLTEYSMVFRLAEQYLIRAEARTQQNNIVGAQSDVNTIRSRAGLSNTTAIDKPSLLTAIEKEKRIEFFAEWGHRWFDLKRWNKADAVLGPIKTPNWQTTDVLYPIPQTELSNDPNLIQNPGYRIKSTPDKSTAKLFIDSIYTVKQFVRLSPKTNRVSKLSS